MKIEQVTELIQTQIQLYPNTAQMDDKALAYYASAIADIEDKYLIMAFRLHLETHKWYPSVAEIREAAAKLAGRKSGIPIAHEAWMEAMKNAGMWINGWENTVDKHKWSHPLIKETARLLWQDIITDDNQASIRKNFIDAYKQIVEREEFELITSRYIREFSKPNPMPVLPEPEVTKKINEFNQSEDNKLNFRRDDAVPMPDRIHKKWLALIEKTEANPLTKRRDKR